MTFLPSFLLAIISTLDLTNKKSLSILISHPYIVLLPTFTMYSFSKVQAPKVCLPPIGCGDRRIALSPELSLLNIVINVALSGFVTIFPTIKYGFESFLLQPLVFLLPGLLFTLLFLHLEKISCCSCCWKAGRLVRVFDPEQPGKIFIMEGGKVVEVTD